MSIIASQYITGRKIIYLTDTIIYKEPKLEGPYNLCSSIPFEELTAAVASAYELSLLVVELTASPGAVITMFTYQSVEKLYPTPASAYSLATAVT